LRIRLIRRPSPSTPKQVYLLDLDNTLHRASAHILPEINRQMTRYLSEQLSLTPEAASQLRTEYWRRYGATLLGMIRHHGTDPHHFLHHTHQFEERLDRISGRHGSVPQQLRRLPGVRVLLTNAPRNYAVALCKALGLYKHLHAVVSIEDMVIHGQWRPKPAQVLWPRMKQGTRAKRPVFVDDTLEHLQAASQHAIQPVWITPPGLGFGARRPQGRVRHRIRHFRDMARIKLG
jgi:putative hydrolase of the HAD superfamily